MESNTAVLRDVHAELRAHLKDADVTALCRRNRFDWVLGPQALKVWEVLTGFRDSGVKEIRLAIKTIAARANLTERRVKRALVLLRGLGLVWDLGGRLELVPVGRRKAYRRVFPRVVHGTPQGAHWIVVPIKAKHLIDERWETVGKYKHGGRRTGAGRPRKHLFGTPILTEAERKAVHPNSSGPKVRPEFKRSEPRQFKRAAEKATTTSSKTNCLRTSYSGRAADEPRPAGGVFSSKPGGGMGKPSTISAGMPPIIERSAMKRSSLFGPPVATPAKVAGAADIDPRPGPGLGLGLSHVKARGPRTNFLNLPGIPRAPGQCAIEEASVPKPFALDPDASDDEMVRQLACAYRGAVAYATGERCGVLSRKGDFGRGSKHRKTLLDAARIMREQEIPPVLWVLWCCRLWAKAAAARAVPPLTWVFNATRIVTQRSFFDKEAEKLGGQIVFTPALRDLMARHTRMVAAIRACGTVDEARAVADAHFPPGSHQTLVERAREEARTAQRKLWDRARRGEWIG